MIPAEYIVKGFRFSLAAEVQAETGDSVELAFVDQDYSGPKPAAAASAHGIALEVVKGARGQARVRALAAPVGGGSFDKLRMRDPSPGPPLLAAGQG